MMKNIVSVTQAADAPLRLTTLARAKRELSIDSGADDDLLLAKIAEASGDIEAALGVRLARETVAQTFWPDFDAGGICDAVLLDRTPVVSIASVTVDDEEIDADLYRLAAGSGRLMALDASGYRSKWIVTKAMIVTYVGGYALPGEASTNLPPPLESATIDLLQSFWLSRGRDPLVKAEEIPGVIRQEFWVGAIGQAGQLPPTVVAKIAPYRRPAVR